MTLIIGCTLPDGAVLVSDGRVTDCRSLSGPANNAVKVIDDNMSKIIQLLPNVYIGISGLELACERTIARAKETVSESLSSGQLVQRIELASALEWREAMSSLGREKIGDLGIGLLVGGLVNGEPLIVSIAQDASGPQVSVKTKPFEFAMIAGVHNEEHLRVFNGSLRDDVYGVLSSKTSYDRSGPVNDVIESLTNAMVSAIKRVAEKDSTVGGRIHYVIVRRDFEVFAAES